MSLQECLAALPPAHHKLLDPNGPPPPRMMAAKGLAPLPPRDLLVVLAGLTFDADEKLVEAARGTLAKMPQKMYAAALGGGVPDVVLGVAVDAVGSRDDVLEPIVLLRTAPDAIVARVAKVASEKVGEIIANNQERLLRSHDIVDALRGNTKVLRSTVDRVFDFLVREGVFHGDMPETAEAMARLSPTETEAAVSKVELPPELESLLHKADADAAHEAEVERRAAAAVAALEAAHPAVQEEPAKDGAVQEAAPPQGEAEQKVEEAPVKKERVSTLKLIAGLNIAQRVALALKGNKEARSILMRDTNKMVATATIRSPRITEQEVISAAQSRNVVEDVIRHIANSKDLTRSYGVKLALVGNPKTPFTTSIRLLTLLRDNDVRLLAKSKNVPGAVALQAKRLLAARTQK